jgi:hypothetical protein
MDDVLLLAMDESELSRVRTVFNQLRILPIVSPHPVQPNSKFSGHGHFGNLFLPAHSSGAHTDVASPGCTVRLPALLLPASSATIYCPCGPQKFHPAVFNAM